MGNLIKETPYSEITATLEVLDKCGVSRDDLARIRKNSGLAKQLAALIIGKDQKCSFKTWRTLKLGTGLKTADDFCQALKKSGCEISSWAKDLLNRPGFTATKEETNIDLVMVSVAELGFPNGATRQQIYQKAQKLGLDLCPPEVGPQLRLQYPDQPLGEWLFIGMDPIIGSVGCPGAFHVNRDEDGLWLYRRYGDSGDFWGGYSRWVFVSSK